VIDFKNFREGGGMPDAGSESRLVSIDTDGVAFFYVKAKMLTCMITDYSIFLGSFRPKRQLIEMIM
jgi:hypothetical protein